MYIFSTKFVLKNFTAKSYSGTVRPDWVNFRPLGDFQYWSFLQSYAHKYPKFVGFIFNRSYELNFTKMDWATFL
jgi:hypothetical protein